MREHKSSRQRMLDIAVRVLETQGEAAVRVRQVADEAGVAIASLYHFFGNREGLVVAATVERYRRTQIGPIDEFIVALGQCETRDEWIATIRSYLERLFDEAGAERRASRAILLGTALQRPALTESFAAEQHRSNQQIAELLRLSQAKGFIRDDVDVDSFAVFYQGMLLGRVLVEIDPGRVDAEAWNRHFIDSVINALF